jgi:hypothetical protein
MIFGDQPSQTVETSRFQLVESDYLTLESLSFQVQGTDPNATQIRLVVAYGQKIGTVEVGGVQKNLFEKWESQVALGASFGWVAAELTKAVAAEKIPEVTANQLLVNLSQAHESLVTLAEQVIEVLSTAGAISLPPVVARVYPKSED